MPVENLMEFFTRRNDAMERQREKWKRGKIAKTYQEIADPFLDGSHLFPGQFSRYRLKKVPD